MGMGIVMHRTGGSRQVGLLGLGGWQYKEAVSPCCAKASYTAACSGSSSNPAAVHPRRPPQLLHRLRQVPHLAAVEVAVAGLARPRLAAVQRLRQREVDAPRLGVGWAEQVCFRGGLFAPAVEKACAGCHRSTMKTAQAESSNMRSLRE